MISRRRSFPTLILALSLAVPAALGVSPRGGPAAPAKAVRSDALRRAADYSKSKNGLALIVRQDGRTLLEEYHNGHRAEDSHILASATKSFSGLVLAGLVEDGIVSSFDERVAATITEWAGDPHKSRITLRQLLNLTSGLDPGPTGRLVVYAQAQQSKAVFKPGEAFQYGPVPYQVFGEVVKRKLKGETPVEYLTRRVFRPIGLMVTGWRYGQDNNPAMATGATLRAGEWAKFGELVRARGRFEGRSVIAPGLIEELLKPSAANPAFGMGFWLEATPAIEAEESGAVVRPASASSAASSAPYRIVMSAGAGKQRLYIIEPIALVVVRQGKASDFSDAEFLSLLLQ
jgi:CubicO group peptidase (beta-lactamase class C family)